MSPKDFLFTFNPNREGLRKILGDLEADIMEVVWKEGEITVREVYNALKKQRRLAYTTVMTVMSRLAEKGLLSKGKEGAAFVYRATASRKDFMHSTVRKILSGLLGDFATPTLSQFLEVLDDEEPEKLDELARLIEEKRKQRYG